MSMFPFYNTMDFHSFLDDALEPRFGLPIFPSDFNSGRIIPRLNGNHYLPTGYRRPWALSRQVNKELNNEKNSHFTKEGFQAAIDVHHFRPNEINVKIVGHTIVIEGKHEERDDGHGSIQRHFMRKYILPKNFDPSSVHSLLSSDGVLTIKASKSTIQENEKVIPISHTNMPAHLSLKDDGHTTTQSPNTVTKSPL